MRIAIIGGGIAGLTAAWQAREQGAEVVLFEGSDRLGGKLRLETVGDVALDVGAEAILARRPEAIDLIDRVGLKARRVDVATSQASVWSGGRLHPLPRGVMGVPGEPTDVVAIEAHDVPLPDADISVGRYVRERAGQQVLDRLVEPLLGGVYAGQADQLSLAAAAPQLRALGSDPVTAAASSGVAPSGPVFAGISGGVGQLVAGIIAATPQLDLRLSTVVRGLERQGAGWLLRTSAGTESADAVVVAVPAPAAARILSATAPAAAFALADIPYASVAIATFVFDADLDLPGSGFLVPPVEGTAIKGSTFSSNKWGWLNQPGRTVLRASLGRYGEAATLQYDDGTLAHVALGDLRDILGPLPDPAAWHVQRWGGALPQYLVGHLEKVATIDADVASVPGLAVCGAAYRGIGIPAVIGSAQGAVGGLFAELGD